MNLQAFKVMLRRCGIGWPNSGDDEESSSGGGFPLEEPVALEGDYTLQASDHMRTFYQVNGSLIQVRVPDTLPEGFRAFLHEIGGEGDFKMEVVIAAGSYGTVLMPSGTQPRTRGIDSKIEIQIVDASQGGNLFVLLSGDLASDESEWQTQEISGDVWLSSYNHRRRYINNSGSNVNVVLTDNLPLNFEAEFINGTTNSTFSFSVDGGYTGGSYVKKTGKIQASAAETLATVHLTRLPDDAFLLSGDLADSGDI